MLCLEMTRRTVPRYSLLLPALASQFFEIDLYSSTGFHLGVAPAQLYSSFLVLHLSFNYFRRLIDLYR